MIFSSALFGFFSLVALSSGEAPLKNHGTAPLKTLHPPAARVTVPRHPPPVTENVHEDVSWESSYVPHQYGPTPSPNYKRTSHVLQSSSYVPVKDSYHHSALSKPYSIPSNGGYSPPQNIYHRASQPSHYSPPSKNYSSPSLRHASSSTNYGPPKDNYRKYSQPAHDGLHHAGTKRHFNSKTPSAVYGPPGYDSGSPIYEPSSSSGTPNSKQMHGEPSKLKEIDYCPKTYERSPQYFQFPKYGVSTRIKDTNETPKYGTAETESKHFYGVFSENEWIAVPFTSPSSSDYLPQVSHDPPMTNGAKPTRPPPESPHKTLKQFQNNYGAPRNIEHTYVAPQSSYGTPNKAPQNNYNDPQPFYK